jgi:hypothetical protein
MQGEVMTKSPYPNFWADKGPVHLDEHNWFYWDKKDLELFHEVVIDGKPWRTETIKIPLKKLAKVIKLMGWKP